MSAFLICDIKAKDRDKLREYLALSEHTLQAFGGVFHAQARETETLEGEWRPSVLIIAEFPSMQEARQWYQSRGYAKALAVKPQAMDRNMVLTNGLR